jgi:hypothetical protein
MSTIFRAILPRSSSRRSSGMSEANISGEEVVEWSSDEESGPVI